MCPISWYDSNSSIIGPFPWLKQLKLKWKPKLVSVGRLCALSGGFTYTSVCSRMISRWYAHILKTARQHINEIQKIGWEILNLWKLVQAAQDRCLPLRARPWDQAARAQGVVMEPTILCHLSIPYCLCGKRGCAFLRNGITVASESW